MALCLRVTFILQKKQESNHHVSTTKSGIILALDKENGQKLWEYNINAEIGQVGPSIGNGMLFVPTDKIQIQSKNNSRQEGSILAFGLP